MVVLVGRMVLVADAPALVFRVAVAPALLFFFLGLEELVDVYDEVVEAEVVLDVHALPAAAEAADEEEALDEAWGRTEEAQVEAAVLHV
jgi:hypothetical protein